MMADPKLGPAMRRQLYGKVAMSNLSQVPQPQTAEERMKAAADLLAQLTNVAEG